MQLTLKIKGADKIFVAPFISGLMLRRALELMKSNKINDLDAETLDELVQFVVDLYGGQFTVDELYAGVESTELVPVISNSISGVINKTNKATEPLQDPNV
ncbi:phage tail assembly chaperone G [Paenibacillus sp. RC84]|uniref:phage tail assembly chaperone G n=1 Tax=Paenibacillus sp. RC84 TaxID=3156252 RepID=UPI003514F7EA